MRPKHPEIIEAILDIVKQAGIKGAQPSSELIKRFTLSRQQVSRYLNALVKQGRITAKGQSRARRYFLRTDQPQIAKTIDVQELQKMGGEDQLYRLYVQEKIIALKENIRSILHHGFTELVNNVIDHASADTLTFCLEQKTNRLTMDINDDGIGVFRRNQLAFGCDDLFQAVVETAKGKRTSQPDAHAGEGLFFTSRLFDYFSLSANGIEWCYFAKIDDWSMAQILEARGTRIHMEIDVNSDRSPEDVFAQYTDSGFQFKKGGLFVVQPLTINAAYEHVSRSEAKRLLIGAEKFTSIIIDFKNTKRVGQGFADEVFRVFQNKYPQLKIEARNMNPAVEAIVKYVLSS